MNTTKEGFIQGILKAADYDTLKVKRDSLTQEITVLEQQRDSYIAAASDTDQTIALLSEQIKDAFLTGESADNLILKRVAAEAKSLELKKAAKEIYFFTIPTIQKKQIELENEISETVRAATEQCRSSFLQTVDEKMRQIDSQILAWQKAVKDLEDATGVKHLFVSYKWIILSDDGTRYVLLPKMKG